MSIDIFIIQAFFLKKEYCWEFKDTAALLYIEDIISQQTSWSSVS